MATKLFRTKNNTILIIIVFCVIIVAFFLLGGEAWIKGLSHGSRPSGMANLKWVQILISLGIGFLLGLLAARRKW